MATPVALTIAGSDSGGGAGVQADLKTFSALGVYGATGLTLVTVQNTREVRAVHPLPTGIIAGQIRAVLDDLAVDAIKIGALGTAEIVAAVAEAISDYGGPVVLDPVMIAKSGDMLLAEDAVAALGAVLIPRATLLTPNLPEAAALTGVVPAATRDEVLRQGRALIEQGGGAVLMKGGHATSAESTDWLIRAGSEPCAYAGPRLATENTHGTGCTLSAAIAARLAHGDDLAEATGRAKAYLSAALASADRLRIGAGRGPVHHFHALWPDEG